MCSSALALPTLLPTSQRHSSVLPAQEWVRDDFAGRQQASCCLCSPTPWLLCPGQEPIQAVLLCRPHAWQQGFAHHGRLSSGAGSRQGPHQAAALARHISAHLTGSACRYLNGTDNDRLYDSAEPLDAKVTLDLGDCGQQEVSFYHVHRHGVDWCFVDHVVYQRKGEGRRDSAGMFGTGGTCCNGISWSVAYPQLTLCCSDRCTCMGCRT